MGCGMALETDTEPVAPARRPRIAWVGPAPTESGGVPYMATQLLRTLPMAGLEVDAFFASGLSPVPAQLRGVQGLHLIDVDVRWRYDRWYSRTDLTKMASGMLARIVAQARLAHEIRQRHRTQAYAVIYQFSQIELFALRAFANDLPPIVIHPEVHAAGELRWMRHEKHLDAVQRSFVKRLLLISLFASRSALQARDLRRVARVISPSENFARALRDDYHLDRDRIAVVPNPVDLERFSPPTTDERWERRPFIFLFPARMSTRKGVELFVALSHRLRDLRGRLRLQALGGVTQWSDMSALLRGIDPEIAEYRGSGEAALMHDIYRSAHVTLQPSHYEPFALTVAESLACGLPVIASDAVGAVERAAAPACRTFRAGSILGLEQRVREVLAELEGGRGPTLGVAARGVAELHFRPESVARQIATVVLDAASTQ